MTSAFFSSIIVQGCCAWDVHAWNVHAVQGWLWFFHAENYVDEKCFLTSFATQNVLVS